jgi:hypothetical protein
MIKEVTRVTPLENYMLFLQFNDNISGIFDCKPYLEKGVFKNLKVLSEFNQVRLAFGTIEWPCGADFDPEGLYEIIKNKADDSNF